MINTCNNRFHNGYKQEGACEDCRKNYIFWTEEVKRLQKELNDFVKENKEMLNNYS